MKKIIFLLIALLAITTSCDKYESAGYDFSNSIPVYAEITKPSKAIVVNPSGSFNVNIVLREALQEDCAITYSFNGTNNQATILRNTKLVIIKTTIPANFLGTDAKKVVKFILISAKTTKTNTSLTIGRLGAEKESLDITVEKPV